ncbi:MAG: hypothetical protein GVY05_02785 [Bacteroidetes bacterium]|jgi:hypothetical protein|nr:hypothetical protein [Bacteroidota bacterium]
MNAKLTLTIEKEIIEQAKRYAKSENRSLSNLVENFLKTVAYSEKIAEDDKIHPDIEALKGSFKMPRGLSLDYKKEIKASRRKKYLKEINE